MKKGISFVWDEARQKAFEDIKEYIIKHPVLVALILKIILTLYKSHGSLFGCSARANDKDFEQAIYYLSRTLIRAECRYNPVEKECLALVFAIQKTQH